MREPVMEERPVPPLARATMPVMLLAVPPMLRVDVERAVTFAKVFTPEKYGMLPTTAAVDVESPPKVRLGVVPPLEMMGQVPVTEVTAEEVATHAMPPVAFDHPRTIPPVLAP